MLIWLCNNYIIVFMAEITNKAESFNRIKEKKLIDELSKEAFISAMEEKIEKAKWVPHLSDCLTDITHAELENRSKMENNMPLYIILADKANSLASKSGVERIAGHAQDTSREVRIDSCIRIATEANRRVHDLLLASHY